MTDTTRPNIVFILADDMGYGDVRCLNADAAFPTPNLRRIAEAGVVFTDAHSSSSVCSPSRYSILTGRYAWRTYLKAGVLDGAGRWRDRRGSMIEPGRPTVASLLKSAGYRTACVGKWHVGWEWGVRDGMSPAASGGGFAADLDWIDYDKPVTGGPCDVGFDEFFGICGSLDMPPYVYVDGRMPVGHPTRTGSAEEFIREGPALENLRADNVLSTLTDRAVEFVARQDADTPFFLYFPLTSPHTPIAPAPEFLGASGVNPYADFCMETDHRVGQVLDALDAAGLADNTLVVFTTDNGASYSYDQCDMLEERFGHYSSYIYRGYKSDIWDGGHRLPFLVRWPAVATPGTRCDQTVGLWDLIATAAEITGEPLPDDAAEDALSLLPALRGEKIDTSPRPAVVHHSIMGRFAIRSGRWKLCRCPGSGGWGRGDLTDAQARERNLPEVQLYDTQTDPSEQHNLVRDRPDVVDGLTRQLHRIVFTGRSTPGPDRPVSEPWDQIDWLPEIPDHFVNDD